MKRILVSVLFCSVITTVGCDLNEFTGYKHDADPIPDSALLFGTIRNKFTLDPVNKATLIIGTQSTLSDTNGEYFFYYHLDQDEERNKPVPIGVFAHNFLPLDSAIVIFPQNEFNSNLEYATPIIKRMVLLNGVCQAEIFDYQGAEDIAEVYGKFYYRRPGERNISLTTRILMNKVFTEPPNVAYFQTLVDVTLPLYGLLIPNFMIIAKDSLAYADSVSNSIAGVDTLLFYQI